MKKTIFGLMLGVALVISYAICWWLDQPVKTPAEQLTTTMAPSFVVDPLWPKPLPNHWVLGSVIGVAIDAQDHIWVLHRGNGNPLTELGSAQNPPSSDCCTPAPFVLEFNQAGDLLRHWGGPSPTQEYDWPEKNHGLAIDPMGNVWIGGNGKKDGHILKFTQNGKFIQQFGRPNLNTGSNDTTNFGMVAKISFDAVANEAYIADGYRNRRVVVLDITTGAVKRYWGAYGNRPDDTDLGAYNPKAPIAQQFRNPVHAAEPSRDGLVYVCDRANDRVQVFTSAGKFVQELIVAPNTLGDGSTWDIAFSQDPEQTYLYLADGKNERIYIILRKTMQILTQFGDGGRQPGEFFAVHSIATDSTGNLYTTETYEGKRVQRFLYRGVMPVTRFNQGVLWPKSL